MKIIIINADEINNEYVIKKKKIFKCLTFNIFNVNEYYASKQDTSYCFSVIFQSAVKL